MLCHGVGVPWTSINPFHIRMVIPECAVISLCRYIRSIFRRGQEKIRGMLEL